MKNLSWGEKLFFILKLPFEQQLKAYKHFGLYNYGNSSEVSISFQTPCFNNCIFCGRKCGEWEDISEIKRRIAENKILRIRKLNLVANEPLFHPNILEILSFARKCHFKEFGALTSGEVFASKKMTEALLNAGLKTISIPIYGTKQIHDAIVKNPGSFKKIAAGLKNLRNKKANVYIHSMILKQNISNFKNFLKFLSSATEYPLAITLLRPKANIASYKELMPSYTEIIKRLKGYNLHFIDYPLCILKQLSPIDFNAIISAPTETEQRYFYVIKKYISKSAFFYFKLFHFPALDTCKKCAVLSLCPGVMPAYLESYGSAEFHPL